MTIPDRLVIPSSPERLLESCCFDQVSSNYAGLGKFHRLNSDELKQKEISIFERLTSCGSTDSYLRPPSFDRLPSDIGLKDPLSRMVTEESVREFVYGSSPHSLTPPSAMHVPCPGRLMMQPAAFPQPPPGLSPVNGDIGGATHRADPVKLDFGKMLTWQRQVSGSPSPVVAPPRPVAAEQPQQRPQPLPPQQPSQLAPPAQSVSGQSPAEVFLSKSPGNTTLMIRNVPIMYTQEMLAAEWPNNGTYDFLYLPYSFSQQRNSTYAFINFTSQGAAEAFKEKWHKQRLSVYKARKPLTISYAEVQGLFENLKLLSGVWRKKLKRYRPMVFLQGMILPLGEVMKFVDAQCPSNEDGEVQGSDSEELCCEDSSQSAGISMTLATAW